MKILNNFNMKLLALLFMTIDHIGFIFDLHYSFRIIGRLAFPIIAFLIYQGYLHTRSQIKYFLRLFIFGLSIELGMEIIRLFMEINAFRNVFLTLSLGLLSLILFGRKLNYFIKITTVFILSYIAHLLNFDYGWYGVLFIFSFFFYRYNLIIPFIVQVILTCIYYQFYNEPLQYYALFGWIFILLYNNKKGFKLKYLFYIYYPIHLVILYTILIIINQKGGMFYTK